MVLNGCRNDYLISGCINKEITKVSFIHESLERERVKASGDGIKFLMMDRNVVS